MQLWGITGYSFITVDDGIPEFKGISKTQGL